MGFTACVIGGGPAGIAAALNLRRAGAMVTCMELNSTVGGMWASAHGPTAGTHGGNLRGSGYDALGARGLLSPIYPSMQCVLPKDSMAYSDMRFSFLVPQYPHYAAVHEYLQEYAMRKGVHGLVRYNTWVESVAWLGEGKTAVDPEGVNVAANKAAAPSRLDTTSNATGKDNVWLVRTVNVVNGDVTEWKFDCVVVATGRHHRPRLPDPFNYQYKPSALSGVETGAKAPPPSAPAVMAPIPGQTRFMQAGGHVLHASEVKRFRDFTGKTVVVYGNGVSAFEYAKELQRAGALVVHATELERDLGLGREGRGRVERTTSDGDAQAADAEEELPLQQRTIANIRAALERYSPLNNPRFVTKLLSRRNSRLRLSLRASMHGPTGYGDMNRSTNMWDRSFNKPKSQEGEEGEAAEAAAAAAAAKANAAKRVAPPLSESLEALRGAYTEIPISCRPTRTPSPTRRRNRSSRTRRGPGRRHFHRQPQRGRLRRQQGRSCCSRRGVGRFEPHERHAALVHPLPQEAPQPHPQRRVQPVRAALRRTALAVPPPARRRRLRGHRPQRGHVAVRAQRRRDHLLHRLLPELQLP